MSALGAGRPFGAECPQGSLPGGRARKHRARPWKTEKPLPKQGLELLLVAREGITKLGYLDRPESLGGSGVAVFNSFLFGVQGWGSGWECKFLFSFG